MGNSSDPLSPLKSANLLDINELADSPLKNGAQSGQQFPSLYDTLGVRVGTLCVIWVNGYAPEYIIHIHFHRKRFRENVLDRTKREYYVTWFRQNVLDGTKSWLQ